MRRGWMVNVGGLLLAFGAFVAAGCGDDDGPNCVAPTPNACGSACVDLQTNEANCGRCGAACAAGETCTAGTCGSDCTGAGREMCGTACVNTNNDAAHCGGCDMACADGEVCDNGTCSAAGCSDGLTECDGSCVDTDTDEANCGACGSACDGTQNCSAGECVCRTGETDCDGVCANTQNDNANCGTCGTACGADENCIRGECTSGGCEGTGLMMCGDECVDTLNNPENCGSCGNACPSGQLCTGGACECPDPLLDCDGICANTQSDNENCGACGNACADGEVCMAGLCADICDPLTTCPGGCADLQNDPNNCGSCGNVVPVGFICQGGAQVCPPGTLDCAGACVALNDPNNCGACGTVCAAPTPLCQLDTGTGTASCISDCPTDQTRCGASCVNTNADPANCGGCGISCGGGSSCNAGACTCGTLTDCDPSDTALACADLTSDRNNCGACGTACAAGEACITAGGTSSCQVATPTGLRVDCPMTTFPAGSAPVNCQAFLTFGGGLPDQDVTLAPETTWPAITTSNCSGSALCGTANGPQMGTAGATRGRFTPAGSVDAAAVASNVIATPNVTWTRGSVMLSDSITLTTEPAMATGYRIDPENITIPYLFDATDCSGGIVTRFRLLRTFAGGGTSFVPASGWSVTSASGAVLASGNLCDGSVQVATTTAPGGLSAPRAHTLTARVGTADVATTTVTVTNEGRDRLRVVPTAQTVGHGVPTAQFQSFVDFGSLAFEITRLGDFSNVTAVGCGGTPNNNLGYPHYWECGSGLGAGLFPWNPEGADPFGYFNITGGAVPTTTATLFVTDFGVFTPDAGGTDGTWTVTQFFPVFFGGVGSPSQTNFTITVSGRQAVACRYRNNPTTLSVNGSTASPGSGDPGGANQVQVAFSTGAVVGTCTDALCSTRDMRPCTSDLGVVSTFLGTTPSTQDATNGCADPFTTAASIEFACVSGQCRELEDQFPSAGSTVAQTSPIAWTSSNPAFVTVSNGDGTRGVLTGAAPGTSSVGATYTDSFGTVGCTTISTVATASTTAFPVNVVNSMLCDLIVTTRPFDPAANAGALAVGGAADANRTARSEGIQDGLVPLTSAQAGGPTAGQAGLARRRAYYGPHPEQQNPVPSSGALDPNNDSDLGNDPRVLLPNVAGITQQFTAVGYFANDGMSANCGTDANLMFALDISSRVSWDITGTAGTINSPNLVGTALTTDAALTVGPTGLGTVVNSSTAADRIQAIRATVNSGERFCSGGAAIGTAGAAGTRNTTNPCVHALGFEVCGAPDTTAGSVVTTPWTSPLGTQRSPFAAGVTNPARENLVPTTADTDFYETFVGDASIRYYSLQRFTGTCAALGAGPNYRMDFSERAVWTSSNTPIGTVSGGALTAVSSGTTSITSSLTFGATTLTDSLDFRVANGVINSIASAPVAAVAEVLETSEGTPLPGGDTLWNEVWLQPSIGVTGGTVPTVALGGTSANINWILQAGSTNCIQQYDAVLDDWRDFGTVGMGSGAGVNGAARFRANENITMAGCSVTLRPQCTGAQCSPTTIAYTDTAITVRRGSVSASNFFIQSPDRTCNDAPATSYTLARYRRTMTAMPNGMGADFYTCVRPSFGAWLRYDIFGASENGDIDWDVPSETTPAMLGDGGGGGSRANSGYVRYNSAVLPGNRQLRATNLAAGLQDTVDITTLADVADTLTLVSPNTGTSASSTCTGLAAAAPGTGTIESCLLAAQSERYSVRASGPGITTPIDVTTDTLITYTVSNEAAAGPNPGCNGGGQGLQNTADQNRVIRAGATTPLSTRGYCNAQIIASAAGVGGDQTVANAVIDVAILTGPFPSFSTSTGTITMTGAGSIGVVATSAQSSTSTGNVTVNTSWSNVGMGATPPALCSGSVPPAGAGVDCGLTSTNPFAANPWTSRYWTEPPVGITDGGGGFDLVIPGTPEYAFLYAGPVPAAQMSSVVARIPNGPPAVTLSVTVNP